MGPSQQRQPKLSKDGYINAARIAGYTEEQIRELAKSRSRAAVFGGSADDVEAAFYDALQHANLQ